MYFSDSVTLRKVTTSPDSFGDLTPSNTDTVVFADRRSAARSEFYSAHSAGIRVDAIYAVNSEDWGNQTILLDGTTVYNIVRSYQKGAGVFELSCSRRDT